MHLRDANEKHESLGLDSLNPFQTLSLLSGDWTAILPESIQQIAKQLLDSGSQTTQTIQTTLPTSDGLSGSTSETTIPKGLFESQDFSGFNF